MSCRSLLLLCVAAAVLLPMSVSFAAPQKTASAPYRPVNGGLFFHLIQKEKKSETPMVSAWLFARLGSEAEWKVQDLIGKQEIGMKLSIVMDAFASGKLVRVQSSGFFDIPETGSFETPGAIGVNRGINVLETKTFPVNRLTPSNLVRTPSGRFFIPFFRAWLSDYTHRPIPNSHRGRMDIRILRSSQKELRKTVSPLVFPLKPECASKLAELPGTERYTLLFSGREATLYRMSRLKSEVSFDAPLPEIGIRANARFLEQGVFQLTVEEFRFAGIRSVSSAPGEEPLTYPVVERLFFRTTLVPESGEWIPAAAAISPSAGRRAFFEKNSGGDSGVILIFLRFSGK